MSIFSHRFKWFLKKTISFLSAIRGYNIVLIVIAQYLVSAFIFSNDENAWITILNAKLFALISATAIAIAGGYIINDFYDREKDVINRPTRTKINLYVSQKTRLVLYFLMNFLAVIVASANSFNAVLFISVYIFGLWFYSHKLKKQAFIGNVTATILAFFPLFAVFIFFKNYEFVIFIEAIFLGLIILIREIVKDLENMAGDLSLGYTSLPIKYGEPYAKNVIYILTSIAIVTASVLTFKFSLGKLYYFFETSVLILIVFLIYLVKSTTKKDFVKLHNILKGLIVLGVFSILLLKF